MQYGNASMQRDMNTFNEARPLYLEDIRDMGRQASSAINALHKGRVQNETEYANTAFGVDTSALARTAEFTTINFLASVPVLPPDVQLYELSTARKRLNCENEFTQQMDRTIEQLKHENPGLKGRPTFDRDPAVAQALEGGMAIRTGHYNPQTTIVAKPKQLPRPN